MEEKTTSPASSSELVEQLKTGLADTFTSIERQATEIVTDAEQRGRAIVESAEREAEERSAAIIERAEEQARSTIERAERDARAARLRVHQEAEVLRSRLQGTLAALERITTVDAEELEGPGADAHDGSNGRATDADSEERVTQGRFGGILRRQAPKPGAATAKDASVEEKLARMAVKNMAAAGASRAQLVQRVNDRFDVDDAEAIVDDVLDAGARA